MCAKKSIINMIIYVYMCNSKYMWRARKRIEICVNTIYDI